MFVHLRLHTEFSVVDGTTRIDEIVKAAARDAQPALAITDLSNLFGAVKFYKEARKRGVKPLIGAEIWLEGLGKDSAALSRAAHALKGAASNVGAQALTDACFTLEQCCLQGHWPPDAAQQVALVAGLADKTRQALNDWAA